MFLRNCWYIASWSKDLAAAPLARTILNEPVVLYRRSDGRVAALEDRCCHRNLPLSLGRVVGDNLECGYHGLTFDADGACVRVPGQTSIPPGASVRSYPVVERWRWIWIWMGDPALADERLVPDYHWLDDPEWAAPTGYFHLKADYRRLVDNLLDFSHLEFVHRATIGTNRIADAPFKIHRTNDGLHINRWILDHPAPPLFAKAGGFTGKVDRWMNCQWTPPANVVFDLGCAPVGTGATEGNRSKGIELRSLHGITPETETTTHYYWGYARNFALDDDAINQLFADGAQRTFAEDVEVLEAQQRAIARWPDAPTVDINGDAAPLQARRILDRLIAAEQVPDGRFGQRHTER